MRSCSALLLPICSLFAASASANDIQVSNVAIVNNSLATKELDIQFDISWQNSWRGGPVTNWDAAWVFVKYRTNSGIWYHVEPAESGGSAPSGTAMVNGLLKPNNAYNAASNPVVGVFMHRSIDGHGIFSATGASLHWNYGSAGLNYMDIAEVKVFAIEMVLVEQGAFACGSGGTEVDAFTLTTINTGDPTVQPSGTGALGGQAGGWPSGLTLPSTVDFPNGYGAFYCMKYELSQGQYVDFLECLTRGQQVERTAMSPPAGTTAWSNLGVPYGVMDPAGYLGYGAGITSPMVVDPFAPITYGSSYDHNPCNYLTGYDLLAYFDWSGLRPMTELEFEKACRGTLPPVPNEYVWGSTLINTATVTIGAGGANAQITSPYSSTSGNPIHPKSFGGGPARVGVSAAHVANTGRTTSAAGYYGCMDLAGNVKEGSIVDAAFLGFTGRHGDGSLAPDGNPNVSNWILSTGRYLNRGGAYTGDVEELRTSDRTDSNSSTGPSTIRSATYGGRGVRTAP